MSSTSPISVPSISAILKSTTSLAFPTTLTNIFSRMPYLTSLYFIGSFGTESLAAGGLASTISNVSGVSVVVGLSSALVTLVSQSKGSHIHRTSSTDGEEVTSSSTSSSAIPLPQIYLQRAIFLHFCVTLPISTMWFCFPKTLIEPLLQTLGQRQQLSNETSFYLQGLAPGLVFSTIYQTLIPYCQALRLPNLPAVTSIIVLLFHIPINILFSEWFGVLGKLIDYRFRERKMTTAYMLQRPS